MALREAASDPSGFVTVDGTVGVTFDFENPFTGNNVGSFGARDEFPSIGFNKLIVFRIESEPPVFAISRSECLVDSEGSALGRKNNIEESISHCLWWCGIKELRVERSGGGRVRGREGAERVWRRGRRRGRNMSGGDGGWTRIVSVRWRQRGTYNRAK